MAAQPHRACRFAAEEHLRDVPSHDSETRRPWPGACADGGSGPGARRRDGDLEHPGAPERSESRSTSLAAEHAEYVIINLKIACPTAGAPSSCAAFNTSKA